MNSKLHFWKLTGRWQYPTENFDGFQPSPPPNLAKSCFQKPGQIYAKI